MPCVIRRYHVTNMLVFLVVTMIMVNLYAVAVVLSRHSLYDDISALQFRTEITEITVDSNATCTKFVVGRNGMIKLITPVELNQSEANAIVVAIKRKLHDMKTSSKSTSPSSVLGYMRSTNRIKRGLSTSPSRGQQDLSVIWKKAAEWPFPVDSHKFQEMGDILSSANKARILSARNSRKGTQLKVEVILEGGQVALFKPAWYPMDVLINGSVNSGKDRHFGEIAAFYLSQLLGYHNAPIAVGRRVNLAREILANADVGLQETFFRDKAGNLCLYGVCYYCKKGDPVCGEGDYIDGALILIMGKKLRIVRNPWKRTYQTGKFAAWQMDAGFCSGLNKDGGSRKRKEVILDIVAVAIFDFLIGNGDRHHFEMYVDGESQISSRAHSKSILLIDNGKSFGNPYEDYIDVLAPLYQCCRIRQSLFRTLKNFRGVLGSALDSVSSIDALYPLLSKNHLQALDRRLSIVLASVQVCLDRFRPNEVII